MDIVITLHLVLNQKASWMPPWPSQAARPRNSLRPAKAGGDEAEADAGVAVAGARGNAALRAVAR